MAEFASLDEEKLNAYLRSLGSNKKVPKSLLGANLALLWESIGFAKRDQGIEATATAREVNPGTSLFPANAASQRLRAAKVRQFIACPWTFDSNLQYFVQIV